VIAALDTNLPPGEVAWGEVAKEFEGKFEQMQAAAADAARKLLEEKVAKDTSSFNIKENPEETRVRVLTRQVEENAEHAARAPIAALYLCPDNDEIESRQTRGSLERFLADQGLNYGFIITPSLLRLIRRLGDGTKGASFDFSIASAVETEDIESLTAACRSPRREIATASALSEVLLAGATGGSAVACARGEMPGNRFGTWQALQALFRIYDEGLPARKSFFSTKSNRFTAWRRWNVTSS
jgi:hypothetical protein